MRFQAVEDTELFSVDVVELSRDGFEQLFDTLQMVQGLTDPSAPMDHCRREAKVQHEDDPKSNQD
jgi:hypothetical protein